MTSKPSGEGGFDASTGVCNGDQKDSSKRANKIITLSGGEWYSQQAHRAVNQAIGRVIRHRYDYGAILFLDSRFGEQRNQIGVSKWIRPCFEPDKGIGPAIGSLVQFYRGAKKKVEANKEANKGIRKPSIKLMYEHEDESNNKVEGTNKSNLGESVSKISFIKKGNNSETSKNDGYIHPEMITKKVELKDHISRKAMKMINDSTAEARIRRRLQQQKKNMSQMSKPDVKEDQKKSAKFFFTSAQDCLSPPDFQTMRKLLISMKSFGDAKNSDSYLKEARTLIELLLKYDPCRFQSDTQNKNANLLELFLPLLPISYCYSIEKMGCKIRYDNSILRDECTKILKPEEVKVMDSKFPYLMINHERNSADRNGNKKRSNNSYLGDFEVVLNILMRNNRGSAMVQHVYPLVPKECTNYVRKLVNNLQAQQRVTTMKDKDKKRHGESGIKTALFQRPVEQNWSAGVPMESKEKDPNEEDVIEKKDALFRATSMKMNAYNEQQKSWEASRTELLQKNLKRKNANTTTNNKTKHGTKPVPKQLPNMKKPSIFDGATTRPTRPSKRAKSIMELAKSKKELGTEVDSSQELDKCLEAAKAEIYKKAAPRVVNTSRVKSNAPNGMICVICNSPASKVSQ